MGLIHTIHGPMDESALVRTVIFEERPAEFIISVEWRLPHKTPLAPLSDTASVDQQLIHAREVQGHLVKRDCHVILKQPSVIADAIAASIT